MILDDLKSVLEENKNLDNKIFLRTLLKEVIQNYVLNFVYNDPVYKKLLFTGGTCLRKVYGLPRLSEDLDFDYMKDFNISDFAEKTLVYFKETLQYKDLKIKINKKNNILFLNFSVLEKLGAVKTGESAVLFLRCDFSQERLGFYTTEVNRISTKDFTFFVNSYDLPTLFANKIIAFLKREFFKGEEQDFSFKGRDVFDLSWFLERSARNNYALQPKWERIFKVLGATDKTEIKKLLSNKLKKIDKKSLELDLLPFIEDQTNLGIFIQNYQEIINSKLLYL